MSLQVLQSESRVKEASALINDKKAIMERIIMIELGDHVGLDKLARKESKSKYKLKTFGKWEPKNSWRCDDCLLTSYDRDIQWKLCTSCDKKTHLYCQAFSNAEMD